MAFAVLVCSPLELRAEPSLTGHPAAERGTPIRYSEILSFSRLHILSQLAQLGLIGDFEVRYEVKSIALVYRTIDPHGQLVEASGLVVVPQKPAGAASPLLSLQHGTLFLNRDAPSARQFTNPMAQLSVPLAAQGYIVVMPDYLGYGVSRNTAHPYLHAATLAANTIDMIRAAKRLLRRANIRLNRQLFLAGYSEGGYATLAAQREIETGRFDEFVLTGSVPGAGPYDLSGTVRRSLARDKLSRPAIAALLFLSYDTIYHSGESQLERVIRPAYLESVRSVFRSRESKIAIDQIRHATDLFTPEFLSAFEGEGESALKQQLRENDIFDWRPRVPTRLYFGVDDDVVPPANTLTALRAMRASGAPDVEAIPCRDVTPANHAHCSKPFIVYTRGFFQQLARDL